MSWRGTKPHKIEDLIADLDCVQSTARELCEAGGVHSGFWKRATDTISIAKLRSMLLRDTVSKLLLCGHSLGGAVALLNAARLVRSLELLKGSYKVACREKIRCITFGAPQVADERAARAIESMLPSGALLNFVHLGDSEHPRPTHPEPFTLEHLLHLIPSYTQPRHTNT
jgi:predicted lipase